MRSIFKVLSVNLWHGGEMSGLPLEATANLIRQSGAHLVGMQEVASKPIDNDSYHLRDLNTRKIASMLGPEWNYYDQGILTPWLQLTHRHPQSFLFKGRMEVHTPLKWGIRVNCNERPFWMFNAHFAYMPYQPFQLLKIPYENAPFLDTEEEAIESAKNSRGAQVEEMLREIEDVRKENPAIPIFITGDFNEPSHLDWTSATAQMKRHPIKVEWPTTKAITNAGFVDCFRRMKPNEVSDPGYTWSTRTLEEDLKDHHDRLDFVFVGQQYAHTLHNVTIIGEKKERADLIISPYPTDHRAVLAEFHFSS